MSIAKAITPKRAATISAAYWSAILLLIGTVSGYDILMHPFSNDTEWMPYLLKNWSGFFISICFFATAIGFSLSFRRGSRDGFYGIAVCFALSAIPWWIILGPGPGGGVWDFSTIGAVTVAVLLIAHIGVHLACTVAAVKSWSTLTR